MFLDISLLQRLCTYYTNSGVLKNRWQLMKMQTILITGAFGLVGRELTSSLSAAGHKVLSLRRNSQTAPFWDIDRKIIELGDCGPIDAVINLAGENIAAGRWTAARKRRIRQSRVESASLLTEFFAAAKQKPKALISASAIGFYGGRGDEALTEASPAGTGFLAETAQAWEAAIQPAAAAGIRTVQLRLGIVLSPAGGALAKMLPAFTMGLGGVLGSGRQWMSWISLRELPGIISHILGHEVLRGPVNAVSPGPVSNRDFTRTLAAVLCRPALLPAPRLLLRLLLGEMAEELLLASAKAQPRLLLDTGYVFQEPELEPALRHLLCKPG
jgi:uncharacterized protein (TIGR01777 family)